MTDTPAPLPIRRRTNVLIVGVAVIVSLIGVTPLLILLRELEPQTTTPDEIVRMAQDGEIARVGIGRATRTIQAETRDGERLDVAFVTGADLASFENQLIDLRVDVRESELPPPLSDFLPVILALLPSVVASIDLVRLVTRRTVMETVDWTALLIIAVIWWLGPALWFAVGRRFRKRELDRAPPPVPGPVIGPWQT